MGTIANGKDTPLNIRMGTIPDVSGAMTDWYQSMTFTRVLKVVTDFQVVETPTPVLFRGLLQPLKDRDLQLKPEGERAWTWLLLHSDPVLTLDVDEVVLYNGVQTRVMTRKDYSLYGYIEYSLVQDWTGSGP